MNPVGQLDLNLDSFDRRLSEKREFHGLKLWTGLLKRVAGRIRNRDREIYEQLMLLEEEIPEDSFKAIERIGKLKGLVSCLLLSVTLYSIYQLSEDFRKPGRLNLRQREEQVA